jgi:CrcB protein
MIPLVVFVGAGLGGLGRWWIGGWVQESAGASFPWGTLVVNASGSLLLGFLYAFLVGTEASPQLRAFAAIGVCGGYTTFSTFSYESVQLLQHGEWGRAAVYMAGSVALSLAGVILGIWLAQGALRGG